MRPPRPSRCEVITRPWLLFWQTCSTGTWKQEGGAGGDGRTLFCSRLAKALHLFAESEVFQLEKAARFSVFAHRGK